MTSSSIAVVSAGLQPFQAAGRLYFVATIKPPRRRKSWFEVYRVGDEQLVRLPTWPPEVRELLVGPKGGRSHG